MKRHAQQQQQQLEGGHWTHLAVDGVCCVDQDLLASLVGKGVPLDDHVAKLGKRIRTLRSRRLRILVTLCMQRLTTSKVVATAMHQKHSSES